ncbi:MAG: nucleotidyl transferase AbiEii/AbiGii toxin family protein [Verrucomicrobiaceae bacterium]|nr:nucleotidyl transferase AbiEii/AbiGii toxin family protein [Verrucomicrobiaceae bacterium]
MNPLQRERWVNEVLREVMAALMHDEALRQALVFKGAWILNLHLGESRHSMDIDATAEPGWVQKMGSLDNQEAFLREHLPRAVRRHFERQNPVRFTLEDARFERNPASLHPRGWDMLQVKLVIRDHTLTNVRSLPPAELEVAAAESYGPDAVEWQDFLGTPARVYALHRIAGEKLRAYLTSLPEYRAKMHGGSREFRVKDLHDLARIMRQRPLEDVVFWEKALREFKLACESRFVDCAGPETFLQDWAQARLRYEQDRHLSVIPWAEAETALKQILASMSPKAGFPWIFDVPES